VAAPRVVIEAIWVFFHMSVGFLETDVIDYERCGLFWGSCPSLIRRRVQEPVRCGQEQASPMVSPIALQAADGVPGEERHAFAVSAERHMNAVHLEHRGDNQKRGYLKDRIRSFFPSCCNSRRPSSGRASRAP
jgi:hypothetical protein